MLLLEALVWYGLKNGTEFWQPTDGGVGRILKVLIVQEQKEWLESDNESRDVDGEQRERPQCKRAKNSDNSLGWQLVGKMNSLEYKN